MMAGEYMLVSLDWLALPIDPHKCLFVNSSLEIECTNLDSPDFTLPFSTDDLLIHNDQLDLDRTLAIKLVDGFLADTEYFLEFSLINLVENIAKISPSIEIYLINEDGLVY